MLALQQKSTGFDNNKDGCVLVTFVVSKIWKKEENAKIFSSLVKI